METQSLVDFQAVQSSSHLQAQQERSTVIWEDGRSSPPQKGGMLSAREEARESRSWGNVRWIKWKGSGRAQAHSSFLVSQTAVSCLQLTRSESFQNKTWVLGTEHCAPKAMEDRHLSVPAPRVIPRTMTDSSANPQSSLQAGDAPPESEPRVQVHIASSHIMGILQTQPWPGSPTRLQQGMCCLEK